jgi:hypothetical protein
LADHTRFHRSVVTRMDDKYSPTYTDILMLS